MVTISSSKTIQFGEWKFESPVYECGGHLCAVDCLRSFWSCYLAPKGSSILSDGTGKPILYSDALRLLKSCCVMAGIKKNVGMHSLRCGMATHMKNLGYSLLDIRAAGDWQSLSVLRYLSTSVEGKRDIDCAISLSFPKGL